MIIWRGVMPDGMLRYFTFWASQLVQLFRKGSRLFMIMIITIQAMAMNALLTLNLRKGVKFMRRILLMEQIMSLVLIICVTIWSRACPKWYNAGTTLPLLM